MAYTKYYSLETTEGRPIIQGYDIVLVQAGRNEISNDGHIYSYDIDEDHPDSAQRLINKTLIE